MQYHHFSIRTKDIWQAIDFYEQLGFTIERRFTAGITLACWLIGHGTRLELLQIPEPLPAPDCFYDEHYTGYYHFSFMVDDLEGFLRELVQKIGSVKLLLPPQTQTIGAEHFRVAFIADRDGLPIELLEVRQSVL